MELDSDVSSSSSDEEAEMQNIMRLKSVVADDRSISTWSGAYADSTATTETILKPSTIVTKIEIAIGLNKLQEDKLSRLEKILAGRLEECRQKLACLQRVCIREKAKTYKKGDFKIFHCGRPYFKDSNLYRAPDNQDTITMKNLGMYDLANIISAPGWTITDKNEFCSIMLNMSRATKKEQLQSLLNQYNRETDNKDQVMKPLQKKIDKVMIEIKELDSKDLSQLAMPIEYEYDWDTISNQLNNRHSAMEYRGLWKVFLHPSINKSSWTAEETSKLQTCAKANNLHNWDKIANELNTGRSGYQCFVYFRTNMSNFFTGKKWTLEEEEYLKRLVEHYRQDRYIPWSKIAPKMQNRTKLQVYNKYIRILFKKGRFLPEEDAVLLTCVKKYGNDFRHILKYLNGRTLHQVKNRYKVLANNANRISTVWTVEEDKKLVQLMANQDAGSNYSDIVKHFPGKERTTIRSRYITLVKWMRHHPKQSIENAPRRGARRLAHGREAPDLTNALTTLKHRMETEFITQHKKGRISDKSSEEVIEDAIRVALVNELIYEEQVAASQANDAVPQTSTNSSGPSTKPDTSKLHKLLLLLRSRMDKSKFVQDEMLAARFSSLADDEEPVQLPQFKSYSKKNQVLAVKHKEILSIWGNDQTLTTTEYALPPNFATITGCKKLMAYANASTTFDLKKNLTAFKRNALFKEHWMRFLDRFHFLFIWPMMLSNGPPTEPNTRVATANYITNTDQQMKLMNPSYNGITIPNSLRYINKCTSNSNNELDDAMIIEEDDRRISGEFKF